jgi:hypothetical protein
MNEKFNTVQQLGQIKNTCPANKKRDAFMRPFFIYILTDALTVLCPALLPAVCGWRRPYLR